MGRCHRAEGLGTSRLGSPYGLRPAAVPPKQPRDLGKTGTSCDCTWSFDGPASMSANGFRDLLQGFSVWSGVPTAEAIKRSFPQAARQFQSRNVNPDDGRR